MGGTGVLQNPNEVGHGYEDEGVEIRHDTNELTWHFLADDVLDFFGEPILTLPILKLKFQMVQCYTSYTKTLF